MNDFLPQHLDHEELLTLTPEERVTIRVALQARVALSLTSEEKRDIRRTLQKLVYADAPRSFFSLLLQSPLRLAGVAFAVLLLVGASGGGIVFAAEQALPGEILYAVKLHVNETLHAGLQFTAEEKARWAVRRLERRMEELKRLEARGEVGAAVDVAVAEKIEAAAREAEIKVESLPAAAAERAALRTAARMAIERDEDEEEEVNEVTESDVRRASRVVRVLKALRERAERFEEPAKILPVTPALEL